MIIIIWLWNLNDFIRGFLLLQLWLHFFYWPSDGRRRRGCPSPGGRRNARLFLYFLRNRLFFWFGYYYCFVLLSIPRGVRQFCFLSSRLGYWLYFSLRIPSFSLCWLRLPCFTLSPRLVFQIFLPQSLESFFPLVSCIIDGS